MPPCCLIISVFTSGILQKSAAEIAALGDAPATKRRRFGFLRGR